MANPVIPAQAPGLPVPPPSIQLPWGRLNHHGEVYLTPTSFEFLQFLWSSIQGSGGVIDQTIINITNNITNIINQAISEALNTGGFGGGVDGAVLGALAQAAAQEAVVNFLAPRLDFPLEVAEDGSRISSAPVTGLDFGAGLVATQTTPGRIEITSTALAGVSYVPLATGSEPLTFMSNGSGQPMLIPYAP